MYLVKPSYEILTDIGVDNQKVKQLIDDLEVASCDGENDGILMERAIDTLKELWPEDILQKLELAGRTCYKSEDRITDGSARKFVKMLTNRNHESVIEHFSVTVKFITDRGISHEIVRHRLASYSQESTRYVNYNKKGIQFIIPPWLDLPEGEFHDREWLAMSDRGPKLSWVALLLDIEATYNDLIKDGWKPEQARSVLPNALKTEVVMSCNLREWMHVFKMRCQKAAHPQIREIMIPLWREMKEKIPVIFDNCYQE